MTDRTEEDRRMWEVLNIIRPSERKRGHRDSGGVPVPLADERVNTIFPTPSKRKPSKNDRKP
jgi:hypothetical protein